MHEFPTQDELVDLYRSYPFKSFEITDADFQVKQIKGWEGLSQVGTIKELNTWKVVLHNNLNDVAKSYVMMMFYYNKGIPDDPYFISPGSNGQTY